MDVRRLLGPVAAAVLVATALMTWGGAAEGTPASVSAAARHGSEVLGPVGYRKLRLGMSRAQVVRTHQARVAKRGTCSTLRLRAHPKAGGYVSARHGLVAIFAAGPMHTPEGIRVGSTRAQVRAAYPHLRDGANGSYTRVPGNRRAEYLFEFRGTGPRAKAYELALASRTQDCFN